jgi:hypothetical protein
MFSLSCFAKLFHKSLFCPFVCHKFILCPLSASLFPHASSRAIYKAGSQQILLKQSGSSCPPYHLAGHQHLEGTWLHTQVNDSSLVYTLQECSE